MLRQKDSDIQKMLKLFTFLPLPEVEAIVNKHEAKPEARYGQERLAEQVLLFTHKIIIQFDLREKWTFYGTSFYWEA